MSDERLAMIVYAGTAVFLVVFLFLWARNEIRKETLSGQSDPNVRPAGGASAGLINDLQAASPSRGRNLEEGNTCSGLSGSAPSQQSGSPSSPTS